MSIGPYPKLTSLDGAQKNFEDQASRFGRYKAKIASDLAQLDADVATLQLTKIGAINPGAGIVVAGSAPTLTLSIDGALTSTNSAPSSAARLQLGGYRSLTVTTQAGGTTGQPLTAGDYFVEVNGNAVLNVYVPTPASMPPGKVFVIRNNRSDVKGVAVKNTSNQLLFSKYTGLARFSTMTLMSTGSAWRALSITTTL